jgi:TonB family protein
MEAADFRFAAIHYTAVLKHHEAVTGDDAQEYFFVLLDIVNLLKSQTRYHDSLVSHIPRSFYSLSEVFDKLLLATERLVETMPESALLFREQALKACHSHPHLLPAKKLKNLASAHLNDAVRTHGRLSETAIEARFFLGNVYLDTKLYNKAVIEFETVLDALDEILEFTHPLALASHLRLVGIFEAQGKSEFATRHCKAIGQMTVWKDNEQQNPLHRVLPSLQSTTSEEAVQVSLSFDISKLGYVKNARVVDSSHAELNAGILSAFQRWRFAPKYRFGIAMEAKGQQILLEYPCSK